METGQQSTLNLFERFNRWIANSITVKLFSIGFLILILLIPASWIEDLVYERQQRADEAIDEVADKWAGQQTLAGPVLVVPYRKKVVTRSGQEGEKTSEYIENAFLLPDDLKVSGEVSPQTLHRGIFDAVVYESALNIQAAFSKPDLRSLSVSDDMVLWKEARLVLGISDVRGIKDSLTYLVDGQPLEAEPSGDIGIRITKTRRRTPGETRTERPLPATPAKGITVRGAWESAEAFPASVTIKLKLNGSRSLDFIPVGKTTSVTLRGDWGDPSFDGEFLPESREVSKNAFSASWKILHFNRPFPQQWTGDGQELAAADFGVNLLMPVDQYQKSIRTAKYAILVILLTFMALFLVEVTENVRIHPFQYILIGAALIVYYTLLLSLSEHVGYNTAYILSSLATVALVGSYSSTFFTHSKLVVLFSTLLATFYGFLYVIILQQDFSLLIGSIGLFVMVGMLMFFSRKVRWYGETPGV